MKKIYKTMKLVRSAGVIKLNRIRDVWEGASSVELLKV